MPCRFVTRASLGSLGECNVDPSELGCILTDNFDPCGSRCIPTRKDDVDPGRLGCVASRLTSFFL